MGADVDRFFNRDFPPLPPREEFECAWVPELDVFQKNNRLTIRVDVPGLTKEALTIHVSEGALMIEGERKIEGAVERNHWYRQERTCRKFCRTVLLPENVNVREMEATCGNGVLEITAPLDRAAEEAPPRKIDVRGPETRLAAAA